MGEKADSELVRRQNRHIVLNALRQHGALARVELGRITSLSPASITAISAQLIEDNVIHELTPPPNLPASGKRGRPIIRLALKPEAAFVLAVKVSIDDVFIVLADFQGEAIAKTQVRLSTYAVGREEFGARLAEQIAIFLAQEKIGAAKISRIGVAIQGLADMRNGSIVWSPAFGQRNIPVARPIEARLGIPCLIANDADMIAEGLISLDRSHATGVTAAIFTGYGVGMGLIINGQVYHGATGAASEFGHMNHVPQGAKCRCGKRGCVEAYVSDYGILRLAQGQPDAEAPHEAIPGDVMQDLQERAYKGDLTARRAFAGAGEVLGYGIARLIALLNPDRIVLAGPGLRTAGLMEPAMQRALEEAIVEDLRRDVKIEQVSFNSDMIIRGTIDSLLRNVDRDIFAAGPLNAAQRPMELSA